MWSGAKRPTLTFSFPSNLSVNPNPIQTGALCTPVILDFENNNCKTCTSCLDVKVLGRGRLMEEPRDIACRLWGQRMALTSRAGISACDLDSARPGRRGVRNRDGPLLTLGPKNPLRRSALHIARPGKAVKPSRAPQQVSSLRPTDQMNIVPGGVSKIVSCTGMLACTQCAFVHD